MSRLERQETVEYYDWLLHIEAHEFKEELLEIVSHSLLNSHQIQISYHSEYKHQDTHEKHNEIDLLTGV